MTQWQPGYYRGDLAGAVFPAGKGGDVEVHLTFDILDADGRPTGNKRTAYLYTSTAAMPWTDKKLRFLGWNGSTEAPEFTNGNGAELRMQTETFEGKLREKWDLAPPPRENAPPDALGRFAAKFRATGPVPRPATKPPAPPAAKPPPPPAAAAPAPAHGTATTKDQAWAVWLQVYKDGPDPAKWQDAIDEHGKGEASFTPADWQAVADEAVPF